MRPAPHPLGRITRIIPSPLQAPHPSRLSSSQEPHIRKLPPPLPQLPPLLLHDLTCSKHQQSSLPGLLLNFCYEVPLCYEVPFPVHPFLVPLRLLESPTEGGPGRQYPQMLPRLCQEVHPGLDPLREVSKPGLVWGLEGVVWGKGSGSQGSAISFPTPRLCWGTPGPGK